MLNVAREQEVDAIVLAGDLFGCLDGFDTPEDAQRREASLLADLLQGTGLPVLYIMGNDDLVELNGGSGRFSRSKDAKYIVAFCVCWISISLPFMGGTFEKPDADIRIDCSTACPARSETQYLCHIVRRWAFWIPALATFTLGQLSA